MTAPKPRGMTALTANESICAFLGIGIKGKPLTKVDLALRPGELPVATLTYAVTDHHLGISRQSFELHPIGQPEAKPLDLDAMCAKAMKRVHKAIEQCAARQRTEIAHAFVNYRSRVRLARMLGTTKSVAISLEANYSQLSGAIQAARDALLELEGGAA